METLLRQLTKGNAVFFIIVLGIGGTFQNGFHITVISSPSPYIQRFINTSWSERYEEHPSPHTVTLIWSAIVSLYAVGGLFGSVSVRCVAGTFGRKRAMIGNNLISIAAAVIMLTSKEANSFEMILVARFLFGFASGLGSNIHAIYLGESSPQNIRGMVTLTSATFVSIGKLTGQFVGLNEILGKEELWNVLLCVPAFFAVVQLLTLPFFPEAPRYSLIEKNDADSCRKALESLWGRGAYKLEMEEMLAEQASIKGVYSRSLLELVRDRSVRWQLLTMVVLCTCIQFSGISAISVFSFDIFLEAGIPREMIRYVTLGIGVSEVLTSITCGLLIERVGRRWLLCGGFFAMSATTVLITITLTLKNSTHWLPYCTVGLVFLFIIFFSGGPAGVMPSLTTEIFIQSCRPAAFVFTGIQRWLGFAILGLVFPFLLAVVKSFSFVLFASMCLLASLYVFFYVPETKGMTILEISEEFKSITVCGRSLSRESCPKSVETRL